MDARAVLGAWALAACKGDAGSTDHYAVLTTEHQQKLLRLPPAPVEFWFTHQTTEVRSRKLRKDTYAARKKEAEALRNEVDRLTTHLSRLKQQREDHERDARATNFALALKENDCMRSLIRMNQQMLTGVHSTLSDWMSDEPSANPLTSSIHLTCDIQHRRNTLLAMKEQKLAMADQYLRARNRQRSLFKPYNVTSQCETDQGDFCCVHADIVQIKGAKGARQVYDSLMFTMANMEISVSEKLGEITVREDYDMLSDGVGNYRMRSWEHPTVSQETNCVLFTNFFENQPYSDSSDDLGYGVTSIDFVDQDDLNPYRPNQNMRQDVTVACTISTHRDATNDQDPVVVIQRVGFIKMHSTSLISDKSVLDGMREGATRWCDIVLTSMREYVASAQNSPVAMITASLETATAY